jgi:hypothetical protein
MGSLEPYLAHFILSEIAVLEPAFGILDPGNQLQSRRRFPMSVPGLSAKRYNQSTPASPASRFKIQNQLWPCKLRTGMIDNHANH